RSADERLVVQLEGDEGIGAEGRGQALEEAHGVGLRRQRAGRAELDRGRGRRPELAVRVGEVEVEHGDDAQRRDGVDLLLEVGLELRGADRIWLTRAVLQVEI